MKQKALIIVLLVIAVSLTAGLALAEEADPISCDIEVSPTELTGPSTVNVTITVSNSGSEDMKDPVTLYAPNGKPVADFGVNGEAMLPAGDIKTWTGTWDVTQKQLESGYIYYYIKYNLYKENGELSPQSQPIREKISYQSAVTGIDIKRTISPGAAREGQTVTVKYDITNTGTVALTNLSIKENSSISKSAQSVDSISPSETATVKFEVKMAKKDLTSSATVSYKTAESSKTQTQAVDEATIKYGEPSMTAKLTASAKGVPKDEKITLTLELKNNGTVDYSDIRVTDPTLGEVFTNQLLASKGELKLDREITLTQTGDYQFTIEAIDNTGTLVSLSTDALTLTAVDPDKVLALNVSVSSDRTEVYETPGIVRFSVTVENPSEIDAKDVVISQAGTNIYTIPTLAAGESYRLTRDAALSMAGKYQFTATTVDALDNIVSFKSNEIQIAFSVPTPAPATATPPPVPTAEPTFRPVTMAPITDPAIAPVPKLLQSILMPLMIACGVLLLGAGVLLIVATIKRAKQKRASDAAYDHLERAKRRDYVTPAEPTGTDEAKAGEPETGAEKQTPDDDITVDVVGEEELPHMKYVRDALERKNEMDEAYAADEATFMDAEGASAPLGGAEEPYDEDQYEGYYDEDYAQDDWEVAPAGERPEGEQELEGEYEEEAAVIGSDDWPEEGGGTGGDINDDRDSEQHGEAQDESAPEQVAQPEPPAGTERRVRRHRRAGAAPGTEA